MRRGLYVVVGLLVTATAGAQSRADSLLEAGSIAAAESLYYRAVSARPRDPQARRALGRYLASRGSLRVGAVLLEEARQFGGDSRAIAADLAPIYSALGEYRSLATLPGSPLTNSARAQMSWLVAHQPTLAAEESVTVTYRPGTDPASLGRVALRLGIETVEATIVPAQRGVVLSPTSPAVVRVHRFTARGGEPQAGVIDTASIGSLRMTNLPVTIEALPRGTEAIVGLDVIQRFAPTFDPRAGRILLRVAGTVPAATDGQRLASVASPTDLRVVQGRRLVSVTKEPVASLLRRSRWTYDFKRGNVILRER
jgi:hypothetical protein